MAICVSFIVAGAATAMAGNFTPMGMLLAPIPSGHAPGKDNAIQSGSSQGNGLHMAGNDCGICHKPGGKAGNFIFSMAGTVYKDKAGTIPLSDAEILLEDVEGNVISMTSNAVGNFFTYAKIASDPVWGSDPESPKTWRYKAWVKYGDVVRKMVTLAGVGGSSATTARMSCNMHHGWGGSRGSLTTGSFQVLASYPDTGLSYQKHILPILKNCKACHVPGSSRSTVKYGDQRFDYSAGLDLSTYEKDSKSRKGVSDIVDTADPTASLLLQKTVVGAIHSGGSFWIESDNDYRAIRQWIAEGAQNN